MRERISVEVRVQEDGTVRPLAFVWKGRRRKVASLGRRWQAEDGEHFLVRTAEGRVYELAYEEASGDWWLSGTRASRAPRTAA
ncbi:MAG: hypothetical protein AB1449_00155 [Chloroflexota bacterium]